MRPTFRSGRDLVTRLSAPEPLYTIELRPPRRDPLGTKSREHWIDLYHALRRLAGEDTLVFTTDGAVGASEEESLRHLAANLGDDADSSRVIPFLTTKHPLAYCLRFAERAWAAGHRALVVLGGDTQGAARCVPHAVDLRRQIRARMPHLALGGWANPYRDPRWQVDLLRREEDTTDFILTQVVSHHELEPVRRFVGEIHQRELKIPTLLGVFRYRSGNARTLTTLSSFLPVPVEPLRAEFAAGADADEVCRRTLAALTEIGVDRVYLCNLLPGEALARLRSLRSPTPLRVRETRPAIL